MLSYSTVLTKKVSKLFNVMKFQSTLNHSNLS